MAELQGADVGGDGPTVIDRNPRCVAEHRPEAVGDDVEVIPNRGVSE
ncbi:uncharacterized protein METZ01_LOCUS261824, partial [marine metagenome]